MENLSIFNEINSLYDELKTLPKLSNEHQEKLQKKIRLEFHYNSNHIEGNTLTYNETELLLIYDETRGNHTLREYEEMRASDLTFNLIEELAEEKERPLTEAFIKNLNQVLLVRPYWKEAITEAGQPTKRKISVGEYKSFPNSVQLQNGEIFHYASPAETPLLMNELIEWYRRESQLAMMNPIELAALMHYKFVRIHPFDDGNGRISRLIMNYILIYNNYPPVIIKTDDKQNYLSALRDADTGNINSFIKYISEQLIWSLNLYIKAARNESIDEHDDWKKKLSILKKELINEEELSIVKSSKVIFELINNEILPFAKRVKEKLFDFDDLFFQSILFCERKNGELDVLKDIYELEYTEEIFEYRIVLGILYKDFKRNFNNPFDISVMFKFDFDDYDYTFSSSSTNETFFTKLYHQKITTKDLERIVSSTGEYIFSKIEQLIES